jgi:hypothetical protein
MTETSCPPKTGVPDLVNEIRRVLRDSDEPLTAAKIRDRLPPPLCRMSLELLAEVLRRQAAAHVFVTCPKYRSGQDRYWDRPLRERVHEMVRNILAKGPLPWSGLRRRLPRYARYLAESVLNEQLARGQLYRHPPRTARSAPRFALHPADIRAYLRPALGGLMARLEPLGFSRSDLQRGLRELLAQSERDERRAEPAPRYAYAASDATRTTEAFVPSEL